MNPKPPMWTNVRGIIFDVDGTLYDQRKLRTLMGLELCRLLLKREGVLDFRIIKEFRKVREGLAFEEAKDVSSRQFTDVADILCVPPSRVMDVVDTWIYRKPLKYLSMCRFHGLKDFFEIISNSGMRVGILSDYPIDAKLEALNLWADATCYSLEKGIDRLKPQKNGLEALAKRLDLKPSECMYIGDRESIDGECARRTGMPFLLRHGSSFYRNLLVDTNLNRSCS